MDAAAAIATSSWSTHVLSIRRALAPQKRWATPSWHCGAHNGGNASGVSKWRKRVLRAGHRFYAAARAWMKECALGSVHTSVGAPLVPGASPSKQQAWPSIAIPWSTVQIA